MFEKRKAIIIGETYVFDVLNESNMAVTTSLVTVVKKGKKRHNWIVLSVNNGDVFECHEDLLTPYVDSQKTALIRCQYGTTDFDNSDVEFFDIMGQFIDMNIEVCQKGQDIPQEIKELGSRLEILKVYNNNLRDKVERYASISNYVHNLSLICNIKSKIKSKVEEIMESVNEDSMANVGNMGVHDKMRSFAEQIHQSEFYNKFDDLVQSYAHHEIEFDDFIDNALDCLEEDFPSESLIPPDVNDREVSSNDIQSLKRAASKSIREGNIVFLVGRNSNEDQIALAIYDMVDFDEISTYVDNVYDKWVDKNIPYHCLHKIVMLSVPKMFGGYCDE